MNSQEISDKIIKFIKNTFRKQGFKRGVIALSGGVDSSVCCALALRALGPENIFPVLLPYGSLNRNDVSDALKLIDFLGIPRQNLKKVDIKPAVDKITEADPGMDELRKGNIMARIRMIYIFDEAKKRKALVIGTENKSEHLLGYFTRFGDEASDIEPIRNLYKTEVYELAKLLKLPETILTKNPSAGLRQNQTDEQEFGFSYKDADKILFYYFDKKLSIEEIAKNGIKREVVKKVIEFAEKNSFKLKTPFTF